MSAMDAAAATAPQRIPFDIEKDYDLTKYKQRFLQQYNLVNPLLFFKSEKRILEAQKEIDHYNS